MKSATLQFIEDAIAGGWGRGKRPDGATALDIYSFVLDTSNYSFLLDPLAWQAVGKTRGKEKELVDLWKFQKEDGGEINLRRSWWNVAMHLLVDHLADGKSIEEALELIV